MSGFIKGATENVELSAQDSFPVPVGNPDMLFYLQRDPNINTIVYELNLDQEGNLIEKEPIHVFWIRYAEGGEREELNYMQRKLAYGVKSRRLDKENFAIRFNSYSKLDLSLEKSGNGSYHVYTLINQKKAVLERIFVGIEGGGFLVPNITYVELSGREIATGKKLVSRFKP
nr:DUF4833 domain-containing protein [Cesiribacter sp. SM1]